MRRIITLPLCVALLTALGMAPYQHVHAAVGHLDHADHDHDDVESAIVHIHFYAISVPPGTQGASQASDSDADHASRSLDTFKAISQAAVLISVCPQSSAFVFPPAEFSATVVEAIEPRGHDPPLLDVSAPRAPPA